MVAENSALASGPSMTSCGKCCSVLGRLGDGEGGGGHGQQTLMGHQRSSGRGARCEEQSSEHLVAVFEKRNELGIFLVSDLDRG
jgi:hypothetical protein